MVSDSIEVDEKDMHQLAQKRLQRIKSQCDEMAMDCKLIDKVAHHPYEEIVLTAEENECDIIFMASQGRKGISAL